MSHYRAYRVALALGTVPAVGAAAGTMTAVLGMGAGVTKSDATDVSSN
jgi:hypothetical protein